MTQSLLISGISTALWDTLSEPLCPYIYFVGEHTRFEDHGSLHGAYKSGIRAGDQILSRYCDMKIEEERRKRKEEKQRTKEEKLKNGDGVTVEVDDDNNNDDDEGESENGSIEKDEL